MGSRPSTRVLWLIAMLALSGGNVAVASGTATASTSLAVGEKRRIKVHAADAYNASGIEVRLGEAFTIEPVDGQRWTDTPIEGTAAGWDPGKNPLQRGWRWLLRKLGRFRVKNAAPFELCVSVDHAAATPAGHGQYIASHPYEVGTAGQLMFFANDVSSRYENNVGTIEVDVERVR